MKIIGISGRKQAGKNTVANYINGCILKQRGAVKDFNITSNGELEILTSNAHGEIAWGIFDVTRKDHDFASYAEKELWPFVKIYHFADYLKQMCVDLFDLSPQQVYGTDDDKNTQTQYNMTAREFLQYFGTNIMRSIKDTVWVDYTIKLIKNEQPLLAIIPDVRFPNEVYAIQQAGGEVLRLDRNVFNSDHQCEQALDADKFDWNKFDHIISNESMTVENLKIELQKSSHIWSTEC